MCWYACKKDLYSNFHIYPLGYIWCYIYFGVEVHLFCNISFCRDCCAFSFLTSAQCWQKFAENNVDLPVAPNVGQLETPGRKIIALGKMIQMLQHLIAAHYFVNTYHMNQQGRYLMCNTLKAGCKVILFSLSESIAVWYTRKPKLCNVRLNR